MVTGAVLRRTKDEPQFHPTEPAGDRNEVEGDQARVLVGGDYRGPIPTRIPDLRPRLGGLLAYNNMWPKPGRVETPSGALPVHIVDYGHTLIIGGFRVNFEATIRIPNNGKTYDLPAGLGSKKIYRVADYAKKLPSEMVKRGGVFVVMHDLEALWLNFESVEGKPRLVKIAAGKTNIVTGRPWDETIAPKNQDQDYMVAPHPQPWVDGFKTGDGTIRQFVAVRHGRGRTVEGQVTGEEKYGGMQIVVFEPKPDAKFQGRVIFRGGSGSDTSTPMGLAAGGKIRQKIYPNREPLEKWNLDKPGKVWVHFLHADDFVRLTGKKAPPSPVTKEDYDEYGIPYFSIDDKGTPDLPAQEPLKKVKPVGEPDDAKGDKNKGTVGDPGTPIITIPGPPLEVEEGNWEE